MIDERPMTSRIQRISQLECELGIGSYEHPYGTDPEGLVDEVRVEMERAYRGEDGMGRMPACVERVRDAEIEARKRWPHFFAGDWHDPEAA